MADNNTRIRYSKNANGSLVSMKIYKINGKDYRSHLSNETTGFIHCVNTGERFDVTASSAHKVKIQLKKILVKLGYNFENEERENV